MFHEHQYQNGLSVRLEILYRVSRDIDVKKKKKKKKQTNKKKLSARFFVINNSSLF